ncbi:hypothetical protein [Nocardia sp. IFM 10818]
MRRLAHVTLLAATLTLAGTAPAFADGAGSALVFRHANGDTITLAYVDESSCHTGHAELRAHGYAPTNCELVVEGSGVWWIGAPLGSWYLVYTA